MVVVVVVVLGWADREVLGRGGYPDGECGGGQGGFGWIARSSVRFVSEAIAAWQWWNSCLADVSTGKRVLRINMDETAVCLFQGHGRGNLFLSNTDRAAVQNVPRGKQRMFLTHVAFICDDSVIQKVLPQIVIGNERAIPQKQLATLKANCPANFFLLRRTSAWVTSQLCAWLVRILAKALEPFMDGVQPIFLFDACKQHLSPSVFKACAAACIWPVVVPARTTWLLQPLDTHAFAAYKIYLMRAYQAERVRSPDGVVGVDGLLCSIYVATREVLERRNWSAAFASNGFGSTQAEVSVRVAGHVGLQQPIEVPSCRPSVLQLRLCFPMRVKVPVDDIWLRGPTESATPVAMTTMPRRSQRLQLRGRGRGVASSSPAHAATSSSSSTAVAVPAASSALPAPSAKATAWPKYMTRFQKRTRIGTDGD